MLQHKSYKFRIYPNVEQQNKINKTFGCTRFIWNQMLGYNKTGYEANGKEWKLEFKEKMFKDNPEYSFLNEVSAAALQQARMNLNDTYSQWFKSLSGKRKGKPLGYPKFKKKSNKQSYRLPNQKFSITDNHIRLEKIGHVKCAYDRAIPSDAKLLSVTVSKNPSGQYFVSICTEHDIPMLPISDRKVGIDLGIKDLFILSSGHSFSNPKWFRESQSKLAKAQRHLSRKDKGSNRYNKQRLKVARIHQKISDQRSYFIHNASTAIVRQYDSIALETLNIKGMSKNPKLAKSIQDAGWGMFVQMLDYKCKWYGKTLVKIDRWYPSSKTCSHCDHVMDKMDLSVREWTCPSCHTNHDRDLNASYNILKQGMKLLEINFTSDELSDYKRGESVRLFGVSPHIANSMKRLSNEDVII